MNLQGHRKFLLAALALIVLAILCWFEKIDGGQFVLGLQSTVGAFMLANWAQAKDAAKAAAP